MIMNAVVPQRLPSKASAETFHRLKVYVCQIKTAEMLWEMKFTEDERRRLARNVTRALVKWKNAAAMWQHLYGVTYQRAVIEISATLNWISPTQVDWLLQEGGELPRNPDDLRDVLIARGDLVILRGSRNVFWKGQGIEADWYRFEESWEFFLITSECAKRGEAIDSFSFGQSKSGGVVTKKKSRLKTQIPRFPKSLYNAFKHVGTGTQKFTIPADRIHFFDE